MEKVLVICCYYYLCTTIAKNPYVTIACLFFIAILHIVYRCIVHVLQIKSVVKGLHHVLCVEIFLDIRCEFSVNYALHKM